MPWLLYRYILGELVRVIALTTGVLVTVIAFGATIKPLASGLLDPQDVVKYVGLAIVPMLQFSLPFSAGFAATIVFHRLVTDNEVLAMSVSGLSYRRILVPVVGLGIALTVVMLLLVHQVIPHFWVMMQRTVQRDITRMFEQAVRNREAFALGSNIQVFAEDLRVDENPQDTDAVKRMWLSHVAAAELDREGRITADVTGRIAAIDFFERDGRTFLRLHMQDGYVYKPADRQIVVTERMDTELMPMPDSFRDNPKFMPLARILYIRDHPDEYVEVIDAKADLAGALRRREQWLAIDRAVNREGAVAFVGGEQRYVIRGERMRGSVITREGPAEVRVEDWRGGELRRLTECLSVTVDQSQSDAFGTVYHLTLAEGRVLDPSSGEELFRQSQSVIRDVVIDGFAEDDLDELSAADLLDRARSVVRTDRDRVLQHAVDELLDELGDLKSEAIARIAQRCALSVTGLLLAALGAALAIRLRESLPLTIYLLAFLPAVADILVISGGEQMVRDQNIIPGLIVMWSGNVVLLMISLVTFLKIARR